MQSLAGRVQTHSGSALGGARVCALDPNALRELRCAISDAGGAFQIDGVEGGARTLLASRTGYEPLTQGWDESLPGDGLVLTLQRGGAVIEGVVVDAAGGAIGGARLQAMSNSANLSALAFADDDGQFRIDVGSDTARLDAEADGYTREGLQVTAPMRGVRFSLTAASAIEGQVVAEGTREGVREVAVSAVREDGPRAWVQTEQTDENGHFRLSRLPPGRYSLLALSERWRSEERSVALDAAHVEGPIELKVRAASELLGRVQVGEEPCKEGAIRTTGPVNTYVPLAADGRAAVSGLTPGDYEIAVSCAGALEQRDSLKVGSSPVQRTWTLDRGLVVSGVALTAEGAPLPGARINADPAGGDIRRPTSYCPTDERGEFSCSGLMAGPYDFVIGPGAPLRSESVRVDVSSHSEPIVLRAHEEGAIRVQLLAPQRHDRKSLVVIAKQQGGAILVGDQRGDEVVFDAVPLGNYEVVSESEPATHVGSVQLTRSGQVAELRLTLAPPEAISGRAIDEQGQGVPDAWVSAVQERPFGSFGETTPVLTDGDGAFVLAGLLPGPYTVRVGGSAGEGAMEHVQSSTTGIRVNVQTYGALSGSVSDAVGEKVSEFVVTYIRAADQARDELRGSAGLWSLPALVPGLYRLQIEAESGSAHASVEVLPGGDVEVDAELTGVADHR
jgi:protocatechuate 3,4-dioxygenase beta subunit